jgi:hypothetical protein
MREARKRSYWALVVVSVLLAAAHQDIWFWDDRTLVFGFMPVGLLYHAFYSVVAASFWAVAMKVAWPRTVMDAPGAEGDIAAAAENGS